MKREVRALFIPVLIGLLVILVGDLNIQVKAQNQQPAANQPAAITRKTGRMTSRATVIPGPEALAPCHRMRARSLPVARP